MGISIEKNVNGGCAIAMFDNEGNPIRVKALDDDFVVESTIIFRLPSPDVDFWVVLPRACPDVGYFSYHF